MEKHGIIRNVTVANVSLANGLNGVRIKAYPNGSGAIYDIHYRDVAIHNVRNPIIVDGFYCPPTQRPYPCPPGQTAVHIHDVELLRVGGDAHRGSAGYFSCDPSAPCENITLTDVRFQAAPGQPSPVRFNCSHARGHALRVAPPSCLEE